MLGVWAKALGTQDGSAKKQDQKIPQKPWEHKMDIHLGWGLKETS